MPPKWSPCRCEIKTTSGASLAMFARLSPASTEGPHSSIIVPARLRADSSCEGRPPELKASPDPKTRSRSTPETKGLGEGESRKRFATAAGRSDADRITVNEQRRDRAHHRAARLWPLSRGASRTAKCCSSKVSRPGDRARVRQVRDHGSYAEAELVELLAAGPARVEPPCPIVSTCGGCCWQHVAYAEQLQAKRTAVVDALQRIARVRGSPSCPRRSFAESVRLPQSSPPAFRRRPPRILPCADARFGSSRRLHHCRRPRARRASSCRTACRRPRHARDARGDRFTRHASRRHRRDQQQRQIAAGRRSPYPRVSGAPRPHRERRSHVGTRLEEAMGRRTPPLRNRSPAHGGNARRELRTGEHRGEPAFGTSGSRHDRGRRSRHSPRSLRRRGQLLAAARDALQACRRGGGGCGRRCRRWRERCGTRVFATSNSTPNASKRSSNTGRSRPRYRRGESASRRLGRQRRRDRAHARATRSFTCPAIPRRSRAM